MIVRSFKDVVRVYSKASGSPLCRWARPPQLRSLPSMRWKWRSGHAATRWTGNWPIIPIAVCFNSPVSSRQNHDENGVYPLLTETEAI